MDEAEVTVRITCPIMVSEESLFLSTMDEEDVGVPEDVFSMNPTGFGAVQAEKHYMCSWINNKWLINNTRYPHPYYWHQMFPQPYHGFEQMFPCPSTLPNDAEEKLMSSRVTNF